MKGIQTLVCHLIFLTIFKYQEQQNVILLAHKLFFKVFTPLRLVREGQCMAHKESDFSIQHNLFYFFQFSLLPTVWVLVLQMCFHSSFVMQVDAKKIKMSYLIPEIKKHFYLCNLIFQLWCLMTAVFVLNFVVMVSDDSSVCVEFCNCGV